MTKEMRSTKRRWFKLYPAECINGSIRWQLTPSQRGVWYDLLAFSSLCSNTGDISDRDHKPYPHSFIANRLNIDTRLLEATITSCIDEGRITEDDQGIHITNWTMYQSEYDRQKPYRQAKKPEPAKPVTDTPDTLDPALGEAVTLWESNKGLLSPYTFDELSALHDANPEGWLLDSIKEGADQGKLSLAYIKAILKRWNKEGRTTRQEPEQLGRIQVYEDA